MAGPDARNLNLTGVWQGFYNYPGGELTVQFVATLLEAGANVSGSVSETCILFGTPGETMFAIIAGRRDGRAVSFMKTYEGANPNYGDVKYDGELSEDGLELEGRWAVPGSWSGRFLMIRSGNAPDHVAEPAEETVAATR